MSEIKLSAHLIVPLGAGSRWFFVGFQFETLLLAVACIGLSSISNLPMFSNGIFRFGSYSLS